MNPRDAANAKGYIDSVISFTKTKLLPHVPEMTIRFTHSVESDMFPMRLLQNQLRLFLMGRATKGAALVRQRTRSPVCPRQGDLGKCFTSCSWKNPMRSRRIVVMGSKALPAECQLTSGSAHSGPQGADVRLGAAAGLRRIRGAEANRLFSRGRGSSGRMAASAILRAPTAHHGAKRKAGLLVVDRAPP